MKTFVSISRQCSQALVVLFQMQQGSSSQCDKHVESISQDLPEEIFVKLSNDNIFLSICMTSLSALGYISYSIFGKNMLSLNPLSNVSIVITIVFISKSSTTFSKSQSFACKLICLIQCRVS